MTFATLKAASSVLSSLSCKHIIYISHHFLQQHHMHCTLSNPIPIPGTCPTVMAHATLMQPINHRIPQSTLPKFPSSVHQSSSLAVLADSTSLLQHFHTHKSTTTPHTTLCTSLQVNQYQYEKPFVLSTCAKRSSLDFSLSSYALIFPAITPATLSVFSKKTTNTSRRIVKKL